MAIPFEPYSDQALALRLEHLEAKTAIRRIVDHNFTLIASCFEWLDYLPEIGKRERPRVALAASLNPGRTSANHAQADIETLAEFYSRFECGAVPRLAEFDEMARTTATLINCIKRIHHTCYIDEAERYFGDFVEYVNFSGGSKLPHDKFAAGIDESAQGFIAACKQNSHALGIFFEKLADKAANDMPDILGAKQLDYVAAKVAEKIDSLHRSGYDAIVTLVKAINDEVFGGHSISKSVAYVRTCHIQPGDAHYDEIIDARSFIRSRSLRLGKSVEAVVKKEEGAWRTIAKMCQPSYRKQ